MQDCYTSLSSVLNCVANRARLHRETSRSWTDLCCKGHPGLRPSATTGARLPHHMCQRVRESTDDAGCDTALAVSKDNQVFWFRRATGKSVMCLCRKN